MYKMILSHKSRNHASITLIFLVSFTLLLSNDLIDVSAHARSRIFTNANRNQSMTNNQFNELLSCTSDIHVSQEDSEENNRLWLKKLTGTAKVLTHGKAISITRFTSSGKVEIDEEEAASLLSSSATSQITVRKSRWRVALQTVGIGGKHVSLINHLSYCRKWGYDYAWVQEKIDPKLSTPWQKIPATLQLLEHPTGPHYDFIMWMDWDAIFTNCNKSLDLFLERMVRENTSILFSGDALIINSGQMIFKNTRQARDFLRGVISLWYPEIDTHIGLHENGAIAAYIAGARRPIYEELVQAYRRADHCFITRDREWCKAVVDGNHTVIEQTADVQLQKQITYVPKRTINTHSSELRFIRPNDIFIYHCAGFGAKAVCLRGFFAFIQQPRLAKFAKANRSSSAPTRRRQRPTHRNQSLLGRNRN